MTEKRDGVRQVDDRVAIRIASEEGRRRCQERRGDEVVVLSVGATRFFATRFERLEAGLDTFLSGAAGLMAGDRHPDGPLDALGATGQRPPTPGVDEALVESFADVIEATPIVATGLGRLRRALTTIVAARRFSAASLDEAGVVRFTHLLEALLVVAASLGGFSRTRGALGATGRRSTPGVDEALVELLSDVPEAVLIITTCLSGLARVPVTVVAAWRSATPGVDEALVELLSDVPEAVLIIATCLSGLARVPVAIFAAWRLATPGVDEALVELFSDVAETVSIVTTCLSGLARVPVAPCLLPPNLNTFVKCVGTFNRTALSLSDLKKTPRRSAAFQLGMIARVASSVLVRSGLLPSAPGPSLDSSLDWCCVASPLRPVRALTPYLCQVCGDLQQGSSFSFRPEKNTPSICSISVGMIARVASSVLVRSGLLPSAPGPSLDSSLDWCCVASPLRPVRALTPLASAHRTRRDPACFLQTSTSFTRSDLCQVCGDIQQGSSFSFKPQKKHPVDL